MNYDMKKPCAECPYVGKWKGWIGNHKSAQDFVDLARADIPFPCHMTINQDYDAAEIEVQMCFPAVAQCAGQALFMNRMCKLSRNINMARMQNRLKEEKPDVQILWPPEELVKHHGK